jgi:nitroimidazol reductase NimA-like FMN-containing flavoprotein (pyridoxamine 5'-phosphate oxidase superfamily)
MKDQELTKIRRNERAKEDNWIREFIRYGEIGVMATSQGDQPFLVTRNYAYDEDRHAIYLHGAQKGRTFENLQTNPKVCFSVSEMGRLIPNKAALEFGVEYSGAVVFGKAVLVDDEDEAYHGLRLLLKKYFPQYKFGVDYEPITPEALKVTAVFRIDIESWSGKELKRDDNIPGAFYYKDVKREA